MGVDGLNFASFDVATKMLSAFATGSETVNDGSADKRSGVDGDDET